MSTAGKNYRSVLDANGDDNTNQMVTQARVQGGPRGLGPPPLEIEKQKKKVIRANIKLFHLYFATFLVENVIFSASF